MSASRALPVTTRTCPGFELLAHGVEFLGSVPPGEMPAFLRTLDVLAITSLWPENLPLILLEAQASGVPVVASRLAGVAHQVKDERLLFEPGSAEGLAAALDFVARHPDEIPARHSQHRRGDDPQNRSGLRRRDSQPSEANPVTGPAALLN